MVATKGFDEPSLERAILMYATTSVTKYFQTVGRVCRCSPGKTEAEVWDYGGNAERFSEDGYEINEAVDWVAKFNNPKKPGNGVAPVKLCEACDALVPASAMVCPYCQAAFLAAAGNKTAATEADLRLTQALKEKEAAVMRISRDKSPAKIKGHLENTAAKLGAQAAKEAAQEAKKNKAHGYKGAFWDFAAAQSIFAVCGEDGLNAAYPPTNPFYMNVREAARKK